MATIITHKGTRTVKNLGWLVRHAAGVRKIALFHEADGSAVLVAYLGCDRVLTGGGTIYTCTFADYTIARRWASRPSLRGVELQLWDDHGLITTTTC